MKFGVKATKIWIHHCQDRRETSDARAGVYHSVKDGSMLTPGHSLGKLGKGGEVEFLQLREQQALRTSTRGKTKKLLTWNFMREKCVKSKAMIHN